MNLKERLLGRRELDKDRGEVSEGGGRVVRMCMHIYGTVKEQHLPIGGTELSEGMDDENGYSGHTDGNHKLLCTLFRLPT